MNRIAILRKLTSENAQKITNMTDGEKSLHSGFSHIHLNILSELVDNGYTEAEADAVANQRCIALTLGGG
jgi:hypothetical protein